MKRQTQQSMKIGKWKLVYLENQNSLIFCCHFSTMKNYIYNSALVFSIQKRDINYLIVGL